MDTNRSIVGYGYLYGPDSYISMVLEEAEEQGLSAEHIPFNSKRQTIAKYADALRQGLAQVLLVSFADAKSHESEYFPQTLAIAAKEGGARIVAIEDLPQKTLQNTPEPSVIDMAIAATPESRNALQSNRRFSHAKVAYTGLPAHLQQSLQSMQMGKEARLAGDIETPVLYIPGMKRLKEADIPSIQMAIEAQKTIGGHIAYSEHRGTADYYQGRDDSLQLLRQKIASLLSAQPVYEVPGQANPSVHNSHAYLCGYAGGGKGGAIFSPIGTSTDTWVAALCGGITTITLQTEKGDDWFVNQQGLSLYVPRENGVETIKSMTNETVTCLLHQRQKDAFPLTKDAAQPTQSTVVTLLREEYLG